MTEQPPKAEAEAARLRAALESLLRTNWHDPDGPKHTTDCLMLRRVGMPGGCSNDYRTVRQALESDERPPDRPPDRP